MRRDSVPVVLAHSLAGADPRPIGSWPCWACLGFAPVAPPGFSAAPGPGPAAPGLAGAFAAGAWWSARPGGYQAGHRLVHQHARTRETAGPTAIRRLVAALIRWGRRGAAEVDRCAPHVQALLANLAERGAWGALRRLAEAFDEPFESRGSWGAWRDVHFGLQRLAEHRGLEDQRLEALGNTALALERLGQVRQAAATYRSLLEEGNPWIEVAACRQLGLLQARHGRMEEGLQLLTQSLRIGLTLGDVRQQPWSRRVLAITLQDHGRPRRPGATCGGPGLSPEACERSASLNELGWTLLAWIGWRRPRSGPDRPWTWPGKLERRAGEGPALSLQPLSACAARPQSALPAAGTVPGAGRGHGRTGRAGGHPRQPGRGLVGGWRLGKGCELARRSWACIAAWAIPPARPTTRPPWVGPCWLWVAGRRPGPVATRPWTAWRPWARTGPRGPPAPGAGPGLDPRATGRGRAGRGLRWPADRLAALVRTSHMTRPAGAQAQVGRASPPQKAGDRLDLAGLVPGPTVSAHCVPRHEGSLRRRRTRYSWGRLGSRPGRWKTKLLLSVQGAGQQDPSGNQ